MATLSIMFLKLSHLWDGRCRRVTSRESIPTTPPLFSRVKQSGSRLATYASQTLM